MKNEKDIGRQEVSPADALSQWNPVIRESTMRGLEATGLDFDAFNDWLALFYANDEKGLEHLKELSYYAERIRRSRDARIADFILQRSRPDTVRSYDELVDEFNRDLARIKNERDFEAVQEFYRRANKLIRNK